MSDALRDQLLKAGLATEQDVKRVRTEKSRQGRELKRRKKDQRTQRSEISRQTSDAVAAKRERDRELNRRREEERQRKAGEKAARDLVVKHEIAHGKDNDVAFHFAQGERIKHVYVSPEQQKQLVAGEIAIARTRGRFRLIPRQIAERVKPAAPFLISYLSDGIDSADEDAYADHPVPDDLMW